MTRWQNGTYNKAWNSLFWSNHDQPRTVTRFGDVSTLEFHEKSAKMLAICLHMMQGRPYIYQGEEIGMTNCPFPSKDDYRDIETHNSYRQLVEVEKSVTHEDMLRYMLKSSRDHARTPMQWSYQKYAGFSDTKPWIMVNPNYIDINVENELENKNSILYTYQKLIQLRKEYDILTEGSYELIMDNHPQIYAFKRIWNNQELIVYCNFSNQCLEYDKTVLMDQKQVIISNYDDVQTILRPYEAIVYLQER